MLDYYKNKVVWITGASSGIGRALALQLDQSGTKLILSARNQDKLEAVAKSITSAETFVLPIDLADSSNFNEKTKAVIDKYGKIDILINNGGISQRAEARDTSEEVEKQIMTVNYFGNVALSKAVLPFMTKQGSGQLVIMSSIAGKFGFFLRSTYSASKHALHGYYESLRLEEEKNGILVSLVCPGKINTPISQNSLKGDGSSHAVVDDNQKNGMPADECARTILKGVAREKMEILVGGKEIKAVKLKRLFPSLLHKILKKQKPT